MRKMLEDEHEEEEDLKTSKEGGSFRALVVSEPSSHFRGVCMKVLVRYAWQMEEEGEVVTFMLLALFHRRRKATTSSF